MISSAQWVAYNKAVESIVEGSRGALEAELTEWVGGHPGAGTAEIRREAERMMRGREQATGTHADIHEQDEAYLKSCRANAREVVRRCGWTVVRCSAGDAPRTVEDIHQEVWGIVKTLL